MRKIKRQRNLAGSERDRFFVTTTVETGAEIRRLSGVFGVSHSKLIGDCVERWIDSLETEEEEAAE